ncbi:unnamed protein product [Periconia digitata]|uniref:Uncharacterized protein n=1 Tax=Periconia digitata TaxID=1303443 RepID=A0A9W4XHW3_9PLEO|nr:unnamed protein product [Periconia digitata]
MSDIEKSFSFLDQSIPAWFTQIAEIEAKVLTMQEELANVPPSTSVPLKRKTGSMESLRGDFDTAVGSTNPDSSTQATPTTTRKRKTPTITSGNISGPSKYRARHMIVVAYDGQIQNSFEQLVRAIGTGRNLLRKGKMAAKLDAMAALSGLHDDDNDDEDGEEDGGIDKSKMGYRHRTGFSAMRNRAVMARTGIPDNSDISTQVFDSADKALESAQSLCEKAAHIILREGDCRRDLRVVRAHFEEAQDIAKKEVAKHAADREQQANEEHEIAPPLTKFEATPPSKPSAEPVTPPESTSLLQVDMAHTNLPPSKVMDIEVDDEEEDDDVQIVMPPLRFRSRAM